MPSARWKADELSNLSTTLLLTWFRTRKKTRLIRGETERSLKKSRPSSCISHNSPTFTKDLWLPLPLRFGGWKMSRRVSFASCLEAPKRSLVKQVKAVFGMISISCSLAIPLQASRKFCNVCTSSQTEESTHLEKDLQLWVLLYTFRGTQKPEKSFSSLELLFSAIWVFAASTNSIKWTIMPKQFCTKPWNSRPSQLLRLESSASWTPALQYWQQQTL